MSQVHSTALVSPKAKLGKNVEVGPYSLIGPDVRIGDGCHIGAHAVVEGATRIGARCQIGHGACLGTLSQDKKLKGNDSFLEVGDDNIFREHVTVNGGHSAQAPTRIGSRNFIMIGAHVAHECQVANDITIANNSALGGHVTVDSNAVIGGLVGVHQFVRVGRYAMIGACSKAVMDIPPYSICEGQRAIFYGVNSVGLKRAGFKPKEVLEIRKALKTLLASGLSLPRAIQRVEKEFGRSNKHILHLLEFVKNSERGVSRGEGQ